MLYNDPDGQFVVAIPICQAGAAGFTWFCSTKTFLAIVATATAIYGAYKCDQYLDERQDAERRQALLEERYYGPVYVTKHPDHNPTSPQQCEEDPDFEETTHPEAAKGGRKSFKNKKTGEVVHFDKGKPGETGHEEHDHYHRENPKSVNRHDAYLNNDGNPCGKSAAKYHLYNPKMPKWNY